MEIEVDVGGVNDVDVVEGGDVDDVDVDEGDEVVEGSLED